ncbi:MAG: hypothetical protein L3J09_04845 [Flavobacteriaceae bacterium]|nr:hypothetical protein [Flavobacteriaceae bacterium]
MKKNSYLLIFIISSLLLVSCKAYLIKKYNISDPKIESISSVKKFLAEKEINNENLLFFKDLESFSSFGETYSFGYPEAYFFNKQGNLVDYRKSIEECNANIDVFITDLEQNINNNQVYKVNKQISIQGLNNYLISSTKEINPIKIDDTKTITVIISFATFIGKLNDEKAFDWVRLLEDKNVNYYLLSNDLMDYWGIDMDDVEINY